ncbi:MAG: carboxypeptidase-like regulatory domain-containing protein [Chloroflexi bacterium]|nr:carboxypeptidase-like regulatory domain-containing protein [Chloroflexota bacterium]
MRAIILAATPLVVAAAFVFVLDSSSQTDGVTGVLAPPPKPVWGYVTDEYSSSPIMSATVRSGDLAVETDADGEYVIGVLPKGATLSFTAFGYEPVTGSLQSGINMSVALRPRTFTGRVLDAATTKPVAGATLFYNGTMMTTTVTGTFHLEDVPRDFKVKVAAAGYKKMETEVVRQKALDLKLEPFAAKAIYFSFYTTGWDERRDKLLSLVDRTELNAVVFDVKGDYGYLSYPTGVPLAREIQAEKIMVKDMDAMVASLKKRNIYAIARIVVFKDDELASKRPDLAVKTRGGGAYVDNEGLRWVDPFRKEVWDYNIAIAVEVARKGFDEVQFDYVRFPSEGSVGSNVYSKQPTEESRVAAIAGFLAAAHARLKPLGVFLGADVFGWTMFREDDMGIGQQIEQFAPYVDYLCPMVYPSGWGPGSRGISDPVARPYDIVEQSAKYGIERLARFPTVRLRPWLQDFDDYGPSKRRYGVEEVLAQKKAAAAAGAAGWMFWNASAIYSEAAYTPEGR